VLWHANFGDVPRYGTARCAASIQDLLSNADWKARIAVGLPPEYAEEIPMDLLGLITGLPAEAAQIPWDGPKVRIIEHQAHAPGHAALLIEERGVLVAGDMLSDILMPFLDLEAALMPSSPVTAQSAELSSYAHESNRIVRTCRTCEMAVFPTTRGSVHWPR
jgi:glyoxylase-like metal-dependent hydrolase (beta-lactamase superfamily II)